MGEDVAIAEREARVLHWNIHSWRDADGEPNLRAVENVLAEADPHVVSLVEVKERWGAPESLRALAGRLGYAWVFAPAFEYGDARPRGGYGNALLVRPPLLAVQHWQLLWPPRTYEGTEPSEPRSVVLARVGLATGPVWIGSTHLPLRRAGERADALRRLLALAGDLDGPWLVCGDFNTPAATWIEDGGPVLVRPDPPAATYPADRPARAIDYCVASPDLAVAATVPQVYGSDHLPVEFSVTAAP